MVDRRAVGSEVRLGGMVGCLSRSACGLDELRQRGPAQVCRFAGYSAASIGMQQLESRDGHQTRNQGNLSYARDPIGIMGRAHCPSSHQLIACQRPSAFDHPSGDMG